MLRAIIFDFDYTLGDSTNGIVLSINYALEHLRYPVRNIEEIKKTIGLSLKETYFELTSNSNVQEAEQFARLFKERADQVMVDNTRLYDGVKEVLGSLQEKGYKTAIVTTKFHYRIEQILDKFDASDLIDLIVGAEDVKVEKPSPEGLLWAIDHLSVNASDVLYVGDSIVDAKTAENANVAFAATLTGATGRAEIEKYANVFCGNSIPEIYHYVISCN